MAGILGARFIATPAVTALSVRNGFANILSPSSRTLKPSTAKSFVIMTRLGSDTVADFSSRASPTFHVRKPGENETTLAEDRVTTVRAIFSCLSTVYPTATSTIQRSTGSAARCPIPSSVYRTRAPGRTIPITYTASTSADTPGRRRRLSSANSPTAYR